MGKAGPLRSGFIKQARYVNQGDVHQGLLFMSLHPVKGEDEKGK